MLKRSVFTTITPLPAGITRQIVIETLHNHMEMIDLNPLVEERHPIKPPADATPEEFHSLWYSITDRISYLPRGLISGKVSYNACLHDLENGLQTHCYAPMGLNIKTKWSLGGSCPEEPIVPVEMGIGAPILGLYLREDVDMRCNIMMTSFTKKVFKSAHARLVSRMVVKAQVVSAPSTDERIREISLESPSHFSRSQSTIEYPLPENGDAVTSLEDGSMQRDSRKSHQYESSQVPFLRSSGFRRSASPHDRMSEAVINASYTAPLNVHHLPGSSSYSGSYIEPQRRQLYYLDPATDTLQDSRISCQSAPSHRSLSITHIDPAYEQVPPYTVFPQTYHAGLHSNERQRTERDGTTFYAELA